VGLFLVLVLILLFVGLSLPDQISKKIVFTFEASPQQVWTHLADNDHQLLWRTNLINIEKMESVGSKPRYRETLKGDLSSVFEVWENDPEKKIVKKYIKGKNKGSSFTIIILPRNENRCDVILVSGVAVGNPFERILFKIGILKKQKAFISLEELAGMFTEHMKQKIKDQGG
jgi:hypothetical protein